MRRMVQGNAIMMELTPIVANVRMTNLDFKDVSRARSGIAERAELFIRFRKV